ncbi:MAG: hypothetical protein WDZ42_02420 [Candidatus Saccharimonadales bacterium]
MMALCLLLVATISSYSVKAFTPELGVEVSLTVQDTSLRVMGQTSPGAFVTVIKNTAPMGTIIADNDGSFDKEFSSQDPGLYNIRVFAETNNNQVTDTISQQVSLFSQTKTTVSLFLPTTIKVSPTQAEIGETISIEGFTAPDVEVSTIFNDDNVIVTPSGSDGFWSLALSTENLTTGENDVYAVASDESGNQSYPTNKRIFSLFDPDDPPPVVDDDTSSTDESVPPIASEVDEDRWFYPPWRSFASVSTDEPSGVSVPRIITTGTAAAATIFILGDMMFLRFRNLRAIKGFIKNLLSYLK